MNWGLSYLLILLKTLMSLLLCYRLSLHIDVWSAFRRSKIWIWSFMLKHGSLLWGISSILSSAMFAWIRLRSSNSPVSINSMNRYALVILQLLLNEIVLFEGAWSHHEESARTSCGNTWCASSVGIAFFHF